MADETFAIGFAVGVQSAFGTPNATIAALSGSLGVSDGIVLGDAESGDAESGIVTPSIEGFYREVADVSGSYTKSADAFLRAEVNSLAITIALKGNGATATPASDEAQPDAGIDALWQMSGLTGATGSNADYEYTPTTGLGTIYGTVKLWIADLSFVFTDVLVDSAAMAYEPGDAGIATFNLSVGTHDPSTDFADGVTFPDFDYGTQTSLAAPVIEGVGHAWGQTRGFNTLTATVAQELETFGDSNVDTTGLRQSQTGRTVTVDGTLYIATADSDFEYQNLVSTTAPTDNMTFQVGTANGAGTGTLNAVKVEVNNLQGTNIKYNRIGTATAVELAGAQATGTTAGSEFKLSYN